MKQHLLATSESRETVTRVGCESIHANAAILAWRAGAVVDERLAISSRETVRARTCKIVAVGRLNARTAIQARVDSTRVDRLTACWTCVAERTVADKACLHAEA